MPMVAATSDPAKATDNGVSAAMKLLHVDEDPGHARLLREQLSRNDAPPSDLAHQAGPDEALARLNDERFDCILLGLRSPDGDDLATCSRLSAAAPRTPVVVVAETDCEAGSAIEAGAEDHLVRGDVDGPLVMRRVRFAIERRKYEVRTGQLAVAGAGAEVPGRAAAERAQSGWLPSCSGRSGAAAGVARQRQATGGPGTGARPLRLLHVEDDPAFARLLRKGLTGDLPVCFALDQVGRLAEGLKRLDEGAFDAILLDLSLPDSEEFGVVSIVCSHAGGAPVLVVTGHDDDALAIRGLQQGAQDYLLKSQLDIGLLVRSIRLAFARQARRRVVFDPGRSKRSTEALGQSAIAPCGRDERRKHPRYLLTRPIFAIPVLPDGSPAGTQGAEGFLNDLSAGGMGFQLGGLDRLATRELVVGVEADDGVLYFATVDVRHASAVAGGLRAGGQFPPPQRDWLRPENLLPTLDPRTYQFRTGLPEATLVRWVELGIFRPVLVDRILVCPECQALPTFRNGCRACGSVRLASCQLIHHFACAHVGFVADFERSGEIVCPKCRMRGLVVGTDFEHLDGPFRCLDCKWSDTELEFVGQCLRCGLRFPAGQLCEKELIGYHVNRLDSLALIGAS